MDPIRRALADRIRARADRQHERAAEEERRIADRRALGVALDLVAMRVADGVLSDEQVMAAFAAGDSPPVFAITRMESAKEEAARLLAIFDRSA